MNLLIGVSGSVAAIKLHEIILGLKPKTQFKIACVFTANAFQFIDGASSEKSHSFAVEAIRSEVEFIRTDSDDKKWTSKGDPVEHIELRKWADLFVILPCSANTLSGIATGRCDNLLTGIIRAWEFENGQIKKPIIVFPCMNTAMWEHPITAEQLEVLKDWGFKIVPPIRKTLACGDIGSGALPEVPDVIKIIKAFVEYETKNAQMLV